MNAVLNESNYFQITLHIQFYCSFLFSYTLLKVFKIWQTVLKYLWGKNGGVFFIYLKVTIARKCGSKEIYEKRNMKHF